VHDPPGGSWRRTARARRPHTSLPSTFGLEDRPGDIQQTANLARRGDVEPPERRMLLLQRRKVALRRTGSFATRAREVRPQISTLARCFAQPGALRASVRTPAAGRKNSRSRSSGARVSRDRSVVS